MIFPRSKKHELDGGKLNALAVSAGYVMYRRPGKSPSIMTEKEWLALEDYTEAARSKESSHG